jgi:Cytochrome c
MSKRVSILFVLALFAVGALVVRALQSAPTAGEPKALYPPGKGEKMVASRTSAARGRQLVMLGGCNDCHTPKLPNGQLDTSRLLSGHPEGGPIPEGIENGASTNLLLTAWRGPWGLTLTRNLTPDNETGIGKWTLADFKKTIRTGVDPNGEVLYPPMPIPMYQNLPDEDLTAIYNYLRTIKPIHNNTRGRMLAPAPPAPKP